METSVLWKRNGDDKVTTIKITKACGALTSIRHHYKCFAVIMTIILKHRHQCGNIIPSALQMRKPKHREVR